MLTLIISLVLAFGVVSTYWSNDIVDLNAAAVGSDQLNQLGTVASFNHWLGPLRMLGMAFLFSAITIALTVIIGTLKLQGQMLKEFANKVS